MYGTFQLSEQLNKKAGHHNFSNLKNNPIQATFLPILGQIASMALEELSFESINERTDGRTDDGQKVFTTDQPEDSSGVLITITRPYLRVSPLKKMVFML